MRAQLLQQRRGLRHHTAAATDTVLIRLQTPVLLDELTAMTAHAFITEKMTIYWQRIIRSVRNLAR